MNKQASFSDSELTPKEVGAFCNRLEADGWIVEYGLNFIHLLGNSEKCKEAYKEAGGFQYTMSTGSSKYEYGGVIILWRNGLHCKYISYENERTKKGFDIPPFEMGFKFPELTAEEFLAQSKTLLRLVIKATEKAYKLNFEARLQKSIGFIASPKKVTKREFQPANFEVVPASKLQVGDYIFGSGESSGVERSQDWLGVDYGLDLKFYEVIKVNRSSFWVVDYVTKKKFKLAKWYWDGSGEMSVRRVPKSWKKRVLDKLIENSIAYRMERSKVEPKAHKARISVEDLQGFALRDKVKNEDEIGTITSFRVIPPHGVCAHVIWDSDEFDGGWWTLDKLKKVELDPVDLELNDADKKMLQGMGIKGKRK